MFDEEEYEKTSKKYGELKRLLSHSCCYHLNGASHKQLGELEERGFYTFFKNLKKGSKILDLGSGTGTLISLAKLCNLKPYGVELSPEVTKISQDKLKQIFPNKTPLTECKNYFDEDFPNYEFEDGTKVSDMNALVCYNYNRVHSTDLYMNLFVRKEFKIGTIFRPADNIDLFINKRIEKLGKEIYLASGLEEYDLGYYKKIKEATFRKEALEELNEELFKTPYTRLTVEILAKYNQEYNQSIEKPKTKPKQYGEALF